jgi:nucleoside-diphosphate-sugar epimerase
MRTNHFQKVFVAGHCGLVGSAIVEVLRSRGYVEIITATRDEMDLTKQSRVREFFENTRPDLVIVAAAKVGGIYANNTYRADFIYENLMIQNNTIWAAHEVGVPRLIFLGSSCIYPRDCIQPMAEESLLTGPLEYSNRPYALAKIAGLELVNSIRQQYGRDYFSVMPTNLYGPNDNFHPENSHVLPALIRKFMAAKNSGAKSVQIWGTGRAKREFLYAPDCADAIIYLAESVTDSTLSELPIFRKGWSHINVGSGSEISIAELARLIAGLVRFEGEVSFDTSMPDGTPRKLLDVNVLRDLGWSAKTDLETGICRTINWVESQLNGFR